MAHHSIPLRSCIEIVGYVDSHHGCHICPNCVTDQEKSDLMPLTLDEALDYKYADYYLGLSPNPNPPVCDRCLEELDVD